MGLYGDEMVLSRPRVRARKNGLTTASVAASASVSTSASPSASALITANAGVMTGGSDNGSTSTPLLSALSPASLPLDRTCNTAVASVTPRKFPTTPAAATDLSVTITDVPCDEHGYEDISAYWQVEMQRRGIAPPPTLIPAGSGATGDSGSEMESESMFDIGLSSPPRDSAVPPTPLSSDVDVAAIVQACRARLRVGRRPQLKGRKSVRARRSSDVSALTMGDFLSNSPSRLGPSPLGSTREENGYDQDDDNEDYIGDGDGKYDVELSSVSDAELPELLPYDEDELSSDDGEWNEWEQEEEPPLTQAPVPTTREPISDGPSSSPRGGVPTPVDAASDTPASTPVAIVAPPAFAAVDFGDDNIDDEGEGDGIGTCRSASPCGGAPPPDDWGVMFGAGGSDRGGWDGVKVSSESVISPAGSDGGFHRTVWSVEQKFLNSDHGGRQMKGSDVLEDVADSQELIEDVARGRLKTAASAAVGEGKLDKPVEVAVSAAGKVETKGEPEVGRHTSAATSAVSVVGDRKSDRLVEVAVTAAAKVETEGEPEVGGHTSATTSEAVNGEKLGRPVDVTVMATAQVETKGEQEVEGHASAADVAEELMSDVAVDTSHDDYHGEEGFELAHEDDEIGGDEVDLEQNESVDRAFDPVHPDNDSGRKKDRNRGVFEDTDTCEDKQSPKFDEVLCESLDSSGGMGGGNEGGLSYDLPDSASPRRSARDRRHVWFDGSAASQTLAEESLRPEDDNDDEDIGSDIRGKQREDRRKKKKEVTKLQKKRGVLLNRDANADQDKVRGKGKSKGKKNTNRSLSTSSASSHRKLKPKSPRRVGWTNVPISDFYSDGEECGSRRSKRAKLAPLKYWKSERCLYGIDDEVAEAARMDIPVVMNVARAPPTPDVRKKRSRETVVGDMKGKPSSKKSKKGKEKKGVEHDQESGRGDDEKKFSSRMLPRKYKYKTGDVASIWDESVRDEGETKIIAYCSRMTASDLPITVPRENKSDIVGRAAQAFNIPSLSEDIPGFIAGHLELPPGAVKDEESVGLCSQTFFVSKCQPKSLEVAVADPQEEDFVPETAQRFMLSPGDFFYVPPNNSYRVENHSQSADAKLFWTIIRPMSVEDKS